MWRGKEGTRLSKHNLRTMGRYLPAAPETRKCWQLRAQVKSADVEAELQDQSANNYVTRVTQAVQLSAHFTENIKQTFSGMLSQHRSPDLTSHRI